MLIDLIKKDKLNFKLVVETKAVKFTEYKNEAVVYFGTITVGDDIDHYIIKGRVQEILPSGIRILDQFEGQVYYLEWKDFFDNLIGPKRPVT